MNTSDLNYEELTGWLPFFMGDWSKKNMRTVLPGRIERVSNGGR